MRLLCIQTYPGANDAVMRHYPYYERAGADKILGVTTIGGGCYWPTANVVEIGPNRYVSGSHLCNRLLDTIAAALERGASEIIAAEYDTLFFKPLPLLPPGLTMNRKGGGSDGFKGSAFYHGPWCMEAHTGAKVVEFGREMIKRGDIERGFPDRFIGLLAEQAGITVNESVFTSYTQNTLDRPEFLEQARQAVKDGATAVHGVKTQAQLEAIIT